MILNESAVKIPLSHSIQSIFHMPVNLIRKNIIFQPDSSRVIPRYMYTNDQRSAHLITRILALPQKQHQETVVEILRDYSKRHRSISSIFYKNFNKLVPILKHLNIDPASLSNAQKGLIGSYFTMHLFFYLRSRQTGTGFQNHISNYPICSKIWSPKNA